jgi:regulator of cell morphogenesis and NO signaling
MSDLLKEDPSFLLTITRFGFSLGFGDKIIREVCIENKVDVHTFVSVINFIAGGYKEVNVNYKEISIDSLVLYLKNAHEFFLHFKLPLIRKKLIEALTVTINEDPYRKMILKFYDEYVTEVQKHMDYENKIVFPYTQKLASGIKDENYNIAVFEKNHDNIESKLADLKNILMRYFPASKPNYMLNEVLFDLSACEKDLERHNMVEDLFFVPVIESLEKSVNHHPGDINMPERVENLSERELEVLTCVVKGMTNKDIAGALFLSTHTVISHRRNIARKLEIHSTAGLTIYAIVNKLVTIDDIKSVIS